jgi:hypothetical protein
MTISRNSIIMLIGLLIAFAAILGIFGFMQA